MWHASLIYVPWFIHMWHVSFICERFCFSKCYRLESRVCVACLMHTWHDSSMRDLTHSSKTHSWVTWLFAHSFIHDMTHSYVTWLIHVWHDSFLSDTWQDPWICDTTHSYLTCLIHMWHEALMCDMTGVMSHTCHLCRSHVACECIRSHVIHMSHMMSDVTYAWVMSHATGVMWHDAGHVTCR